MDSAKSAQAALALNPHSISAAIALGEAKRAQGDLKDALNVFQGAIEESYRQYPNAYEPPTLLLARISALEEELDKANRQTAQK